jgi:tetratricopeptide (TPR) repeat protein
MKTTCRKKPHNSDFFNQVFAELPAIARVHLPTIGLFSSFVHASTLTLFLGNGDRQQERYEEIIGESLTREQWLSVLNSAAEGGLISARGKNIFEIDEKISAFLIEKMQATSGTKAFAQLEEEFASFYSDWTANFVQNAEEGDQNIMAAVEVEHKNLLKALAIAQRKQQWEVAFTIVEILALHYRIKNQPKEWRILREALLDRLGAQFPTSATPEHIDLWCFLMCDRGRDALTCENTELAEKTFRYMIDGLESSSDPSSKTATAKTAESLADIYLQSQQYPAAIEWLKKGLSIRRELGQERETAFDLYKLGRAGQETADHQEAEAYFNQALEIFHRLGMEQYMAAVYSQLGLVTAAQKKSGPAKEWFEKAAQLFDEMDMVIYAAENQHHLGIISCMNGEFDRAREWLDKALQALKDQPTTPTLINTLAQLGVVSSQQDDFPRAIEWLGKALSKADEIKFPVTHQIMSDLATLMNAMGVEKFTRSWNEAFDGEEPPLAELKQFQKSGPATIHQS